MSDIYVIDNYYQGTANASIADLTPPTFAGVTTLTVESRGQIRAKWNAATDATTPLRYEVYIQASTATGLFNVLNIVGITDKLQFDTFTMPDGSFLVNGTTYYVGVRALDGVSNRDSNVVSLNVLSTGVYVSNETYSVFGAFVVNNQNQLQGTLWATKNNLLANSPGAVLGTASYQVYDRQGNAVVGMTQSGITADSNGQYIITPVSSSLSESLEHYMVKVTISVDGANRTNYVSLIDEKPEYEVGGVCYLDETNTLQGSFWVSQDEKVVTSGLGVGAYQVFDAAGNLIIGLSETGIAADGNGIFSVTPFALPPSVDSAAAYSVRITIQVNGVSRSDFIVLASDPKDYGVKAQFSINALNQFQGTLWGTDGHARAKPSVLGNAAYQVYDKDGVAVVGLSETGITPDGNGLYAITPVSAALLTDLTHYTVKITIEIGGVDRIGYKGFTLLGT